MLQQFLNLWTSLTPRRRLIIALATVGMFAAVLGMARLASTPNMTLLYAGLESGAAGEVVRNLEQRGVAYDIRGGSIFVDSAQRDELRLTLASEGLPANGGQGYELLDTLSGFGTTSQMFDAAYWRAKEGELARTIVSSTHIASARVHIANGGSNPFQRDMTPSASVAVTPSGGPITPAQARSLRFLVASAVTGLEPDDVAIIDSNGALIGSTDETAPASTADDRSEVLRTRVERMLERHVGVGNAVVEVSVDTVTETESIRERVFDPESRVAISTDIEETTTSSSDVGGGDVTVASNLPDGDGAGDESSTAENTETRERFNYEVSQTEREVVRGPGAIRRLTVAVLIGGTTQIDENGAETFVPRPEAEIAALRELVAAAVGFDETRGDIITLKSMPLQTVTPMGTAATTSLLDQVNLDLMSVIQMLVLAVVTLILGLFVIRPLFMRQPALANPETAELPAPDSPDLELPEGGLTGEIAEDNLELPDLGSLPQFDISQPLPDLPSLGGLDGPGDDADPVARLRALISERQEETVEILRGWLEEREEPSG